MFLSLKSPALRRGHHESMCPSVARKEQKGFPKEPHSPVSSPGIREVLNIRSH